MAYHFIKTKEQLRQLLPTTADVSLEFLQSYFSRAEFSILRPHFGTETLNLVRSEVPAVLELHALATRAVATYGYREYAAGGQQQLTGTGPRRFATAEDKPLTAPELAALLRQLEAQAYQELDECLVHLEEHPEVFTAWHHSTWSTILAGQFFATADQFSRYATAEYSRLRFRRLWPALNAQTLRYLRPLLGRPLLARLLDEQELEQHRELVNLLRTALAGLVLTDDELATAAGHAALDEIRYYLHRELVAYPEFDKSPAYEPTELPADQSDYQFYSAH